MRAEYDLVVESLIFVGKRNTRRSLTLDRGTKKGKHFEINKAQRIIARFTIVAIHNERVTEQLERGSKE